MAEKALKHIIDKHNSSIPHIWRFMLSSSTCMLLIENISKRRKLRPVKAKTRIFPVCYLKPHLPFSWWWRTHYFNYVCKWLIVLNPYLSKLPISVFHAVFLSCAKCVSNRTSYICWNWVWGTDSSVLYKLGKPKYTHIMETDKVACVRIWFVL
jgi:hypothetical protein